MTFYTLSEMPNSNLKSKIYSYVMLYNYVIVHFYIDSKIAIEGKFLNTCELESENGKFKYIMPKCYVIVKTPFSMINDLQFLIDKSDALFYLSFGTICIF